MRTPYEKVFRARHISTFSRLTPYEQNGQCCVQRILFASGFLSNWSGALRFQFRDIVNILGTGYEFYPPVPKQIEETLSLHYVLDECLGHNLISCDGQLNTAYASRRAYGLSISRQGVRHSDKL